MDNPPTVSAIVLNYRTPQDTLRCVQALLRQTIAQEVEVIVIDNHSGDDSLKIFRSLLGKGQPVQLLETPENIGYGRANNLGAKRAQGEFLLIVNPDTSLEPDAVEKMVAFLRSHPDVGILGPQLVLPNGKVRDSFRTFPTPTDIFIKRTVLRFLFRRRMSEYLQWHEDPNATRDVHWVVGACLLMRRHFFQELGGFDPRFFLFFEDTDLCRRCWEAGKRVVYFPLAKAHDGEHRLSSGGLLSLFTKKTMRIHLTSAVKYFWKWRKAKGQVGKVGIEGKVGRPT